MKAIKSGSNDPKPNAWIVNPKDKGRKSIKKNNTVYLQNNQSFEIELFNPLTEPVLADIKVNSKSVSSSGLIIRPGERFYLDCFIDDKKKFIFKTYNVEKTEESINAVSSNGLVEILFYKEETSQLSNWRDIFYPTVIKYYPVYYPWYQPYWYYGPNPNIVYGSTLTTSNLGNLSTTSINLNNNTSYSIGYSSADTVFTSNSCSFNNSIETGRIEKGSSSSQQFIDVDINFEKYHISSVLYKLLPESQKPLETKDIKNFCSNCGKKTKGENFCSNCGNKLK